MPMGKVFFSNHFKFIFYNRLYLGPCNSVRTAEIIEQSSDVNLPIVGLRSNSIKVDYKPNASVTASSKIMKLTPCAVRVIIYNSLLYKFFDFSSVNLIF